MKRTRKIVVLTALLTTLASLGGCWDVAAGAAAGGAVGYFAGKEGAKNAN